MHKFLKKTRAETIAEIMIALVIILLAVATAFKTLALAFSQKNLTQDKVMAINLAREGMEAVRYIRDYNWLYYGSKPRVCWNHLQDFNNDGVLDGDESNSGGINESDDGCEEETGGFAKHQIGSIISSKQAMEYVLKANGTHWFLSRCADENLSATPCATLTAVGSWDSVTADKMFAIEGKYIDGVTNDLGQFSNTSDEITKAFQICKDARIDSTKEQVDNALYVPCTAGLMKTKFFRYVKIEYDGDPQHATTGKEENMMKVLVGVKWLDGEAVQDVELVTVLSDFYGRTDNDEEN